MTTPRVDWSRQQLEEAEWTRVPYPKNGSADLVDSTDQLEQQICEGDTRTDNKTTDPGVSTEQNTGRIPSHRIYELAASTELGKDCMYPCIPVYSTDREVKLAKAVSAIQDLEVRAKMREPVQPRTQDDGNASDTSSSSSSASLVSDPTSLVEDGFEVGLPDDNRKGPESTSGSENKGPRSDAAPPCSEDKETDSRFWSDRKLVNVELSIQSLLAAWKRGVHCAMDSLESWLYRRVENQDSKSDIPTGIGAVSLSLLVCIAVLSMIALTHLQSPPTVPDVRKTPEPVTVTQWATVTVTVQPTPAPVSATWRTRVYWRNFGSLDDDGEAETTKSKQKTAKMAEESDNYWDAFERNKEALHIKIKDYSKWFAKKTDDVYKRGEHVYESAKKAFTEDL